MLRTVLYQCFGLVSASVYPNDLGRNQKLESYVGHIEHDESGKIGFPKGAIPFIKTHEPPSDSSRTIYIVRNGGAACVSLWEFYQRRQPLEAIIAGQHRFGTWENHLLAWQPWDRQNTLVLKYEEILDDLSTTLDRLSAFTGAGIVNTVLPDRESIVGVDGRWVRKKSNWRDAMTKEHLDLFYRTNGIMMEKFGYTAG